MIFGGSYGIGKDIGDLAETYGAVVERFSRSGTNTDVQNRRDIQRAHDLVLEKHRTIDFVVNTAGILQIGELKESSEETIFAATEINYLAPIYIAQTFYNELAESQGSLLLHLKLIHSRTRGLCTLFLSKSRNGQPNSGAIRRVGIGTCPSELHQSRAHGNSDENQSIRR